MLYPQGKDPQYPLDRRHPYVNTMDIYLERKNFTSHRFI
jgi:hypothetical protein